MRRTAAGVALLLIATWQIACGDSSQTGENDGGPDAGAEDAGDGGNDAGSFSARARFRNLVVGTEGEDTRIGVVVSGERVDAEIRYQAVGGNHTIAIASGSASVPSAMFLAETERVLNLSLIHI